MTDVPKSLYAKLAEVMLEIGYVEKRGHNAFHGYKYVTEADLVDAVRSKLAARNVVVLPSLTGIEERPIKTAKGKDSTITTARVAFTFCDGDTGQTHTSEWAGAGDDPADKGLYKAMTGAAKYFLMKSFLIPTGDDPEADAGTDERAAGGQLTQPKPAPMPVSDVPAEDVWWHGSIKPLLAQVKPNGKALREAVEVAQGEPLGNVGSWEIAITRLTAGKQRDTFRDWLTQKAGEDTPMADEAKGATA